MKINNDFIYLDIFCIKPEIRNKLHLTDKELNFTSEDIDLINNSDYVDLDELKKLLDRVGFTNLEIPNELGISKAMYTMAFNPNSKNHRGLRMRTIIAILNAIRNRNIKEPFNNILCINGGNK